MSIRAPETQQPATHGGPRRARPPLPDRPPLRPAAYIDALRAQVAPAPRRATAAFGTGALMCTVAVLIATVSAGALAGAWLLLSRMAG